MKLSCQRAGCGKLFEAQRSHAKYCSSGCRSLASQARKGGAAAARAVKPAVPAALRESSGVVAAVMVELEAAGRLGSVLGGQALALARAVDDSSTSGAAVASLSRELRTVMAEVVRGGVRAADGLDEVAARRAAKAASA